MTRTHTLPLSARLTIDDLTVRSQSLKTSIALAQLRGEALEGERELLDLIEQTIQQIEIIGWGE